MKRTLTTLILGLVVCSSFAQGTLTFNNSSLTLISTNSVEGGPPTGPTSSVLGSYFYAMFTAPVSVTTYGGVNDANWTLRETATNTAAASGGRLVGGQPPTALPGGSTVNFIILGWEAHLGTSWAQALNNLNSPFLEFYWLGQSAIGMNAIFNDPAAAPVNGAFGTTGGPVVPGFVVNFNYGPNTPEPSCLVISGLGAALLLLNRRRK